MFHNTTNKSLRSWISSIGFPCYLIYCFHIVVPTIIFHATIRTFLISINHLANNLGLPRIRYYSFLNKILFLVTLCFILTQPFIQGIFIFILYHSLIKKSNEILFICLSIHPFYYCISSITFFPFIPSICYSRRTIFLCSFKISIFST